MKEVLQSLLKVVKNKYVFATAIFIILLFFMNENNLILTLKLKNEVHKLHAQERALVEETRKDSIQAESLKYDMEAIERYGREHYFMKRADEDIYIVKD
ncbi:MAG: septum formation initiator family protein [Bacteroidales bacterium]|nr:septum formation initiator family protein [Bacteroidales bacterium]